jgi:hypothetical protein
MGSISTGAKGIAAGIGGVMIVSAAVAMGTSPAKPPATAKVQNDPDAALCMPAETPLFTCTLDARRASVCQAGGKATYRYGRPGRIELSSQRLTMATRSFSGGGESQITATNNGHSYTMFDRTVRTGFGADGRNDPQSETGLIVRQGNKRLSARICDNDTPISARSRGVIPAGSFVPH